MKKIIILITLTLAFAACGDRADRKIAKHILIVDQTDSNKILEQLTAKVIQGVATPTNEYDGQDFCLRVVGDKKHIAGFNCSLAPVINQWDFNEFHRRKEIQTYQKAVTKAVRQSVKDKPSRATHSYVFWNLAQAINSCKSTKYVSNQIHVMSDLRNKDELFDSYRPTGELLNQPTKFKEFMDKHYLNGKSLSKYGIEIHFYFQSSNRTEDQAYDQILNALQVYYQGKGIKTVSHNSFSNLKN